MQAIRGSRSRYRAPGRAGGYSMIELITTAAVAAVLVAVALPNFREFNRRSNVTELNNGLVGAINLARAEAVKRGRQVALVSASNGNNWSTGWSVIVDDNSDGSFAGADSVLQTRAAIHETTYKVTTKASGAGATDGRIVFEITGTLRAGTRFDINVCRNGEPAKSKHVVVSATGMTTSYFDVAGSPAPSC